MKIIVVVSCLLFAFATAQLSGLSFTSSGLGDTCATCPKPTIYSFTANVPPSGAEAPEARAGGSYNGVAGINWSGIGRLFLYMERPGRSGIEYSFKKGAPGAPTGDNTFPTLSSYSGLKTALWTGSSYTDNQIGAPVWSSYTTRVMVTLYGAISTWQTCSSLLSDATRFPATPPTEAAACAEVYGSFSYQIQFQVLHSVWQDSLIWFGTNILSETSSPNSGYHHSNVIGQHYTSWNLQFAWTTASSTTGGLNTLAPLVTTGVFRQTTGTTGSITTGWKPGPTPAPVTTIPPTTQSPTPAPTPTRPPIIRTTSPPQVVTSNSPSVLTLPIWMFAVIVIGGVCCILLMIVIIIIIVRRRKRVQQKRKKDEVELSGVGGKQPDGTDYNVIPGGRFTATQSARSSITSLIGKSWEIPYSDIKLDKELGRGAFGVVYLGKWRLQAVAVKKLKDTDLTERDRLEFQQEVILLSNLRPHRSVVSFFGMCVEPLCLVLEFMSNGSVQSYLRQDVKLELTQLYQWLIDIAAGMAHLHSEGVIHRDLSARNLLLDDNLNVKITDFGLSRVVKDSSSSTGTTKSEVGPLKWMGPESLTRQQYSPKSDVWSFGIVIIEMLTRDEPYPEMTPLNVAFAVGNHGASHPIPEGTPPELAQLMTSCWQRDPNNRPSFVDVFLMVRDMATSIGAVTVQQAEKDAEDTPVLKQYAKLPKGTVTVDQYARVPHAEKQSSQSMSLLQGMGRVSVNLGAPPPSSGSTNSMNMRNSINQGSPMNMRTSINQGNPNDVRSSVNMTRPTSTSNSPNPLATSKQQSGSANFNPIPRQYGGGADPNQPGTYSSIQNVRPVSTTVGQNTNPNIYSSVNNIPGYQQQQQQANLNNSQRPTSVNVYSSVNNIPGYQQPNQGLNTSQRPNSTNMYSSVNNIPGYNAQQQPPNTYSSVDQIPGYENQQQ